MIGYNPDAPIQPEGTPGVWLVCEHPERPIDEDAGVHSPDRLCPPCIIWAEAALRRGDVPGIGHYLDSVGEYEVLAS